VGSVPMSVKSITRKRWSVINLDKQECPRRAPNVFPPQKSGGVQGIANRPYVKSLRARRNTCAPF